MTATTTPTLEHAGLEPRHDRPVSVHVYRRDPGEILARGTMHDEKPPGVYVEWWEQLR